MIRNDPKVRREDYANGLRFWLSHPDKRLNRILFLENSREDLSYFQNIVAAENAYGKEVEFVSTDPAVIPKGISFGWGELRMLDEGLERSHLARQSSQIIKATGRRSFRTSLNSWIVLRPIVMLWSNVVSPHPLFARG